MDYTQSLESQLIFTFEPWEQSQETSLTFLTWRQSQETELVFALKEPYSQSQETELRFWEKFYPSQETTLIFKNEWLQSQESVLFFKQKKKNEINLFGIDIQRYKLFGIYITSRKPKQTQNITANFNVTTIIEYIELEYECALQWLNKYEKEKIIRYIRNNNGKKIKIEKSLFNENEGIPIVKVGDNFFNEILCDYDSLNVNSKGNFFDIKMKFKVMFNINPMTWNDVKTYTWNDIKNYSWDKIRDGGI